MLIRSRGTLWKQGPCAGEALLATHGGSQLPGFHGVTQSF